MRDDEFGGLKERIARLEGELVAARAEAAGLAALLAQERRLSDQALHDELTGLPNRQLLQQRLRLALESAARDGHKVAIGLADLDHFKVINETLGPLAGDSLLREFAARLLSFLRGGVTVGRWGGDEFAVLLPVAGGLGDALALGEALVESTREPFIAAGCDIYAGCSVGLAIYPDHGENADALLARAESALAHAKRQGRNQARSAAELPQGGPSAAPLRVQAKLHEAVRGRRVRIHLQPLIAAASGRTAGVEALARWHDPELGWISPAEFIPMAEAYGLIAELGEQIIIQGLDWLRDWNAAGHAPLRLSLNLSQRQLYSPTFAAEIAHLVMQRGLNTAQIMLEVTESVAMGDVAGAPARLRTLAAAGFKLAMDDFGTGYSSLSQLDQMPLSEIKIDISFVRRLGTPDGQRMVRAIIEMGRALNLEVVAEGVEDAAAARLLTEMGADTLQGYHFSRPLAPEALPGFIAKSSGASPG